MKERPILFTPENAQKVHLGTKTQTRRIVKPQPDLIYRLTDDRIEAIYRRDSHKITAATDTDISERRLHGRVGWENIFQNEIQGIWEKGLRGLVCFSWAQDKEGLYGGFLVPSKSQGNKGSASFNLHGISRAPKPTISPGPPPQRQSIGQSTRKSFMGNTGRELDGSQGTREGMRGRKASRCEVQQRGAVSYSVGGTDRTLQPATSSDDSPCSTILNLRDCQFQIGMKLWVRESYYAESRQTIHYRGDFGSYEDNPLSGWKNAMFMPRWACRTVLELTAVRVERLQEISEGDAEAEGVDTSIMTRGDIESMPIGSMERALAERLGEGRFSAKFEYQMLWESINGKGSWALNPWVWVLEFKMVNP